MFPQANYDCGLIYPIEGCFCSEGYILNNDGVCINPLGCKCPEGTFYQIPKYAKPGCYNASEPVCNANNGNFVQWWVFIF